MGPQYSSDMDAGATRTQRSSRLVGGTYLSAHFENSMTIDGWSASGDVDYFHVDFTSGFSWSDYHFTGN
ncbi:MAG: hypothetical protein ACUVV4_06590 [Candidatus Bathyarchaeia archaeon]